MKELKLCQVIKYRFLHRARAFLRKVIYSLKMVNIGLLLSEKVKKTPFYFCKINFLN